MRSVPYLPPRGVRNTATDLHGADVTACSMVSITGLNLAAGTEASASLARPLLAGTAVRVGDHFLPLFSVSPNEIVAQLPCDLAEGPGTLTVRSGYEQEVSTDFTVVRNAPGLFATTVAGQSYAVATHADGSLVTPDHPANNDETVTLYGTGFGPLLTPALEGVVVQPAAPFGLVDPIDVLLDGNSQPAAYAGASGPRAGMNAVQIRISSGITSATLKVRVNGAESNPVILPVQP